MKSRIWLKDQVFAQTKPFQNKETMSGSWQLTSAEEGGSSALVLSVRNLRNLKWGQNFKWDLAEHKELLSILTLQ